MYKKLLDKINEYDHITIFRHVHPDGDAMFSALALYYFIKDNFKDKKLKMTGFDDYGVITVKHKVSDAFIKKSLAIIVDTSSRNRVDDERFELAPFSIKIDHHPIVDQFADLNYVDHKMAACCEYLADIFHSRTFSGYKISPKVCEYLYCGILTDTNNFSTSSTTAKTLKTAAMLAEKGDLKISDLVNYLNDLEIDLYQKVSKMRNYLKIDKAFGYIILDEKDLMEIGIDPYEAKNNIEEIGHIKNLKIWAFAVEVGDKNYSVSVRSKRGYVINEICQKYGGGGHANACGVKDLSKSKLNALFDELIELSTK